MPSNTTNPQDSLQSAPKRPEIPHRHSSTSSQVSISLSEASSSHSQHSRGGNPHNHSHNHHHHHYHHKASRHVVGGHGRLGARNTSGKNLNKLGISNLKLAGINNSSSNSINSNNTMPNDASNHAAAAAAASSGKERAERADKAEKVDKAERAEKSHHHQATARSGDGEGGEASSPRPSQQVKRNASAFAIARNHSQATLRKNYSSGHLPRNQSSKNVNRPNRPAPPAAAKRTRSGRSDRSEPASPAHPTVRFALGDEVEEPEHDDDNWTEGSASASPQVTRDNTRQNSVILDADMAAKAAEQSETSEAESATTAIHTPTPSTEQGKRDADIAAKEINGDGSYYPTRPPDADVLTSRLLQRAQANPQVSTVSATATADSHNVRSLGHSQSSTGGSGSTPGRDLVSRFVNASSVDGTPREGNLLPHKDTTQLEGGDLDASKRNRSAPNFADRSLVSPTLTQSRRSNRSGSSTPNELPPSRTQQKLLLQRASSNIEPQKHIPAVLPRPSASQLLGHGVSFATGESGHPAQVLGLFAQINKEYQVVRRYRSPVADAAQRQKEATPPEPRPILRPRPRRLDENGMPIDENETPVGSFRSRDERDLAVTHHAEQWNERRHLDDRGHSRHSRHGQERRAHEMKREEKGHKSRVSFDLPSVKADDSDEEGSSRMSSERARASLGERNEAYDICRRMWEMVEPAYVEG